MSAIRQISVTAVAFTVVLGIAGAPYKATFAYDPTSAAAINVDEAKLALRGYDPVSYFNAGGPTVGSAEFTAEHEGATYHFVSAANRDSFVADPAKYAPAYGGFCAMGAALGKKLDGDPTIWKVVNDRLYLNVNADAFRMWQQDIPGNLTKADATWPKIKDKRPDSL